MRSGGNILDGRDHVDGQGDQEHDDDLYRQKAWEGEQWRRARVSNASRLLFQKQSILFLVFFHFLPATQNPRRGDQGLLRSRMLPLSNILQALSTRDRLGSLL